MIFRFQPLIFQGVPSKKWLVPCAKLPAPGGLLITIACDPRSKKVTIRKVKTGDASEIMHQLIWYSQVKTNSLPLKSDPISKGKACLSTIHFQGRLLLVLESVR